MGWATTLISPPDGDLARLPCQPRPPARAPRAGLLPRPRRAGPRPGPLVDHVLAHRAAREAEILAALAQGPATVAELVAAHLRRRRPRALHGAAARNVLAHLIDLADRGLAAADGPPAAAAWRLT